MVLSQLCFVYDDTKKTPNTLKEVIGTSRFSEIIYRGKSFESIAFEAIKKLPFPSDSINLKNKEDFKNIKKQMFSAPKHAKVLHLFSYSIIMDFKEFNSLMNNLYCSNSNTLVVDENNVPLMLFFVNISDYLRYLDIAPNVLTEDILEILELETVPNQHFCNLRTYRNLVSYLSKSFDTRFFNFLSADEYTVTKRSIDKVKLKKEYDFYYLLPKSMRSWFVPPYNYIEDDFYAYYTMERYNIPDVSVSWIHKAFSINEFELFLKNAFNFLNHRESKIFSKENVEKKYNNLYIEKLETRISMLKQHKDFDAIASCISAGTDFNTIDEIVDYYKSLYFSITKNRIVEDDLVIGHGDFCFSNILYDKHSNLFRLLDPKGASEEKDLWTDKYYDVAKLSHSIIGLYDFFNSNLHKIEVQQDMKFKLLINFKHSIFKDIFKKYLEINGYDYNLVRTYEASLFLSMLPLHMDNPQKVLGFLLNSIDILKELEQIQGSVKPVENCNIVL